MDIDKKIKQAGHKENFYSRTERSNQRNNSDSKDSQDQNYKSENFSNGDKRKMNKQKQQNKKKKDHYWRGLNKRHPKSNFSGGINSKKSKNRSKRQDYQMNNKKYWEEDYDTGYVKKSRIDKTNKGKASIASSSKNIFDKIELKEFQEFYLQNIKENTQEDQREKPKISSLSSDRSSNLSSRSDDAVYTKTKSLTQKERQIILEESKEYLLQPKKFYNLKFQKKIELIRNCPKKVAREFYKIDYQHKFLSAMNRYFKKHPKELKLFNIPLEFNPEGEVDLVSSYYVLLNSIDFFNICKHCEINSFDAARDVKKVIAQKISLMVKKMKINAESLGKEEYEKNLKFKKALPRFRYVDRIGNERRHIGQPNWYQNA